MINNLYIEYKLLLRFSSRRPTADVNDDKATSGRRCRPTKAPLASKSDAPPPVGAHARNPPARPPSPRCVSWAEDVQTKKKGTSGPRNSSQPSNIRGKLRAK